MYSNSDGYEGVYLLVAILKGSDEGIIICTLSFLIIVMRNIKWQSLEPPNMYMMFSFSLAMHAHGLEINVLSSSHDKIVVLGGHLFRGHAMMGV